MTYELLVGKPPFQNDIVEIAKGKKDVKLSKLEFPERDDGKGNVTVISDEAKDFIENLLQEYPKDRMDMKSALKHPFLRKPEKSEGNILEEINMS